MRKNKTWQNCKYKNSDSRLHRHPRSGTHTELFICCICNCLGDTCYNHSLRFTNEGALEWWRIPASLNHMHSWGRSLSQSPVRLAIPLWFGQRVFWESVKLLTWDVSRLIWTPLKLVPPGTNFSEIFGPPPKNLFHYKGQRHEGKSVHASGPEGAKENQHVRVRCWSVLLAGSLKW